MTFRPINGTGFPAMLIRWRINFACDALARKRAARRKNPKERPCIRCQRPFRSTGPENRLCRWCNEIAERASGAVGIPTFGYGDGYRLNEGERP